MTEDDIGDWSLALDEFDHAASFPAGFSFDDWLDHDQTGAWACPTTDAFDKHELRPPPLGLDSQGPGGPRLSTAKFRTLVTAPIVEVPTQDTASLAPALEVLPQVLPAASQASPTPQSAPKTCPCGQPFSSLGDLYNHCRNTGHAAFICTVESCGSTFSRPDVYQRHTAIHDNKSGRFPCHLCKRHHGVDAFKRKDHLTQHMRNYHHVDDSDKQRVKNYGRQFCPHPTCPDSKEARFSPTGSYLVAFMKAAEHTAHMKKVHNESPFPCTELGCDRVEGKGYFRKLDLLKHRKKSHPEKYTEEV